MRCYDRVILFLQIILLIGVRLSAAYGVTISDGDTRHYVTKYLPLLNIVSIMTCYSIITGEGVE